MATKPATTNTSVVSNPVSYNPGAVDIRSANRPGTPLNFQQTETSLIIPDKVTGWEVAKGKVSGHSFIHKFGRNDNIDTNSGFEDIWNGGGIYTGFNATSAQILDVFSAHASDTSEGVGARTIQLYGLDGNYKEINETLTLNGTSTVNTTLAFCRMHRAIVRSAGESEQNNGDITVRQTTDTANVFGAVPSGYNQTVIAAYTVPAGKNGLLTGWYGGYSNAAGGVCNLQFVVRPLNEVFQIKEEFTVDSNASNYIHRQFLSVPNGPFLEKSDIKIRGDSSANNQAISAGFDLLLYDA